MPKQKIELKHVKLKMIDNGLDGTRIVHGDHYVADVYGTTNFYFANLFAYAPETACALQDLADAIAGELAGAAEGGNPVKFSDDTIKKLQNAFDAVSQATNGEE